MKAQYVKLLSNQYRLVNSRIPDADTCHLYRFIYPQIYASVRHGMTNVILAAIPPESVITRLEQDGFKVYPMPVLKKATVEWGHIPTYSHEGICAG